MGHILDRQLYENIRKGLRVGGKGHKLARIQEWLEHLNANFKKYYAPEEFLGMEEYSLAAIKQLVLCDAVKQYTLEIKVEDENMVGDKLLIDMLDSYRDKAFKLMIDNELGSAALFTKLKQHKIGCLGPVRSNKSLLTQQDLEDMHFKKIYDNDYACYVSIDNMNVLLYHIAADQREQGLMSSFVDVSRNESNPGPYQSQPFMVYLYNKFHKGGEKRRALFGQCQHAKWWRNIVERVFEVSVVNASIVFKLLHPHSRPNWTREFKRMLMKEMAQRYRNFVVEQNPVEKQKLQFRKKTHTIIEGDMVVNCVECGDETKQLCQECTVFHDYLIGICKHEDCYKNHLHLKDAAQDLQHLHRLAKKGRPSTWATIKQLREYKNQLELDNDRISQGTKDFDKAIVLLNETLAKLTNQEPQQLISEELSLLMTQLQNVMPNLKPLPPSHDKPQEPDHKEQVKKGSLMGKKFQIVHF